MDDMQTTLQYHLSKFNYSSHKSIFKRPSIFQLSHEHQTRNSREQYSVISLIVALYK